MITLTYTHYHTCSHQGEEVVVRPEVDGGAYFPKIPMCIELDVELELTGRRVS